MIPTDEKETYLVGIGRPEKSHRDFKTVPVNALEAATFVNLTERQFLYKVKKGELPKSRKGIYFLHEVAQAFWGGTGDVEKEDLKMAKTRLTAAQADRAELELATARGSLHRATDVMAVWSDNIANARSRLLSIPTKLAVECEGLGKLEIERKLKDAIHEALCELAEYSAEQIRAVSGDDA